MRVRLKGRVGGIGWKEGIGREGRRERKGGNIVFIFNFSLNSCYGRASLLRCEKSSVRSTSNVASAIRNKANWLENIKRMDVAGVTLGPEGPDLTFVVQSRSKRMLFSNLATAANILGMSKHQVIRMQWLISRLLDKSNYVCAYT